MPWGKTGIHRPFFGNLEAGLSTQQIKTLRDSMNRAILAYLQEMDVSTALLDAMLAVPPEDMRILGNKELTSFRLIGSDPSWDEKRSGSVRLNSIFRKISGHTAR